MTFNSRLLWPSLFLSYFVEVLDISALVAIEQSSFSQLPGMCLKLWDVQNLTTVPQLY